MNMNHIVTAVVIALALGATACSKNEPEQKPVAAPAQDSSQGMDHSQMPMEHGDMQGDCDMQNMDMSTMSAEEHQAMMDMCQPNETTGAGQGGR